MHIQRILFAAIVVSLFLFSGCADKGPKIWEVSTDDDPVLGDPNAPITIIAFEDYGCAYCHKFTKETLPDIKERYIDTGKARFVFRDYPVVAKHPYALDAAIAANCANEFGRFWEYHDILFTNQGNLTRDDFVHFARILLIDQTEFTACLDTPSMREEVEHDLADGDAVEVVGTPTFFVNGFKLEGAHPITSFDAVIGELER